MSLETLTTKYITSAEFVLKTLQRNKTPISINDEEVSCLLSYVRDYLEDAKYYKVNGKLEISLTSIAYCEGLLDAMKLLGAVTFEWPSRNQEKKP